MGRWATYPTTVEDLRVLNLNFLIKNKYLQPNTMRSGVITWGSNTEHENSISINSNINENTGFINLIYTFNHSKKITYKIQVVSKVSNLGKGFIWFFICPFTGRYCRKLHLINGYFQHRTANPHLMYQKQIEPKIWRKWNKAFGAEFNDHLYFELHKKYFKRFYNGKLTKRYVRIRKKLNQRDEVDLREFKKYFLK